MKIIWSKRASESFEACIEYIEIDNPINAEKWALRVFAKIETMLEFPKIGTSPSKSEQLRQIVVEKNYIVIYRLVKDKCRIVAFMRTSQNIKQ